MTSNTRQSLTNTCLTMCIGLISLAIALRNCRLYWGLLFQAGGDIRILCVESDKNLTLGAVQAVTILPHPKRPTFKSKFLTDNWLEAISFRKLVIRSSCWVLFPLRNRRKQRGYGKSIFFTAEFSVPLNVLYFMAWRMEFKLQGCVALGCC